MTETNAVPCDKCEGTGSVKGRACSRCDGFGWVLREVSSAHAEVLRREWRRRMSA